MAVIKHVLPREIPLSLLLLADEDEQMIETYRERARFWAAYGEDRIIGQIGVLFDGEENTAEIVTVSVDRDWRNRRTGTDLIETALAAAREKSCRRVIVKTGNSSLGPLALYQRCGFRLSSVKQNHFLENYAEPLYENGIRCVDQIILEYSLPGKEEKEAAQKEYWSRFLRRNREYEGRSYSVWSFGLGDRMANDLAGLVKIGRKRGTASARELYEEGEALPVAGELSLITYGNGMPACIIETKEIREKPFSDIDAEEAAIEGEGDGSLEYWQEGHRYFFAREYEEAGKRFSEDIPVIFEVFEVIYDEDRMKSKKGEKPHV